MQPQNAAKQSAGENGSQDCRGDAQGGRAADALQNTHSDQHIRGLRQRAAERGKRKGSKPGQKHRAIAHARRQRGKDGEGHGR